LISCYEDLPEENHSSTSDDDFLSVASFPQDDSSVAGFSARPSTSPVPEEDQEGTEDEVEDAQDYEEQVEDDPKDAEDDQEEDEYDQDEALDEEPLMVSPAETICRAERICHRAKT